MRVVKTIFEEIGVKVTWRRNPPPPSSCSVHIWVILVSRTSAHWHLPEDAMGVYWHPPRDAKGAALESRTGRKAVYVFPHRVRKSLGHRVTTGIPSSPSELASTKRALGRVIAHELVHAILPELSHDEEGLFGWELSGELLQKPRLSLLPATANALVSELAAKRVCKENMAKVSSADFRSR
jgi:hypothetical protein